MLVPPSISKKLLPIVIASCLSSFALAAPKGVIPPEMISLFPVGRTFEGVKIPSYKQDVLQSILEADTIQRVDQGNLDLTNLIIKVYSAAGVLETTIKMDEARFRLVSRELVSKTPARIDHPKFVMTADQMIYNTEADVTNMEGNVRVVIPEANEFTNNLGDPKWNK